MNTDAAYYRLAMKIFADFSGTIALPAVLAALLGKWLDVRYGTEPWLLISLLVFALLSTAVSIKRKAKRYADQYQTLIHNEKKISKL